MTLRVCMAGIASRSKKEHFTIHVSDLKFGESDQN